ncbi:hypothetical protein F7018_07290 [Tenacibaculum aiptasiae]|uniref:Bacteriocin n=1 Tax=Tenacibaculum aiptasiae TaxID=426481 RepID=A0A7J5AN08_9FLAO|nr:hypothetical protein [Tenacibaculum aiptasiae]KAB1158900.1 hypothetical protein F7018_07290 [Tenacibaculum aiptasiae]
MKNLKKLGNALSKNEQKAISGGGEPHASGRPCTNAQIAAGCLDFPNDPNGPNPSGTYCVCPF